MKASETDILLIPGHGAPHQDHWQNRWSGKLATARRVEQSSFMEPDRDAWVDAIRKAIADAERPVVLVAHSLGIGAALHALDGNADKIVGGFFVSPPDLTLKGPHKKIFETFGPYPNAPLPFPSITVASQNDIHGSYEHAGDVSNAWGSFLVDAGNSGHIDIDSGHGPWPEGTMVFAQFLSRLKPRN
ncbi:alpha/beta hydrolase [Rhizobium sp. SG_E_25_P2]|uniref:RBBP9/YdeN family alpha/beta hydrolase n=1 Tax=Rhizobium sp. SG_E_25_P2 TaxID=2879942 RepID=UPI0024767FDF|nr:alpha/beta hydrolase [Rhizobium sp. SG_E_25_P2]